MSAPSSIVLVPGPDRDELGFLTAMLRRRHEVVLADPEGADLAAFVGSVRATIASVERPPVVVGYAIGAAAAIRAAVDDVDAVAGVVAIAGWLTPGPKLQAHAGLWPALADRPEVLAAVVRQARWSADGWESAGEPAVDARAHELVVLSAQIGLEEVAPRLRVPALVISCRYDEVAGVAQSRLLFGALPDARYAEVASGHAVLRERPAEVLQLVDEFADDPTALPAGHVLPAALP